MIDSHAHVSSKQFNNDRDEVINRMTASGVEGWIEIGTTAEQSKQALLLVEQHDNAWATIGVHPDDIRTLNNETWLEIEEMIEHEKAVGIGEVGLDYYRSGKKVNQLPVLDRFVSLAVKKDLPVVFHVRSGEQIDANDDLIEYLQGLSKKPKGVLHTFSGNVVQAGKYVDLGFYLGISGIVTFKNAGELIDVVRETPLDKLLIETDSPYLAPEPHRGERNEPSLVRFVAQKIADIKEVSLEEVDETTKQNTKKLFKLK